MVCGNCGWTGPLCAADTYEGVAHCPRCIAEPLKPSRGLGEEHPKHPPAGPHAFP